MTTTLEEIHRDPAILDRAISRREELDIVADGEVAATLLPKIRLSVEEARNGDAGALCRAGLGVCTRHSDDEP